MEGLVIRKKSLTYSKTPQKLKIRQKRSRVHSMETSTANTKLFKVKKLPSKTLANLPEETQFSIRTKVSVIQRKTFTYTKIPQKTEKLSKMVQGALFGTFPNQY